MNKKKKKKKKKSIEPIPKRVSSSFVKQGDEDKHEDGEDDWYCIEQDEKTGRSYLRTLKISGVVSCQDCHGSISL